MFIREKRRPFHHMRSLATGHAYGTPVYRYIYGFLTRKPTSGGRSSSRADSPEHSTSTKQSAYPGLPVYR